MLNKSITILENLKGRDHLEEGSIDVSIILKWISRK
jgi:hypothetical protein